MTEEKYKHFKNRMKHEMRKYVNLPVDAEDFYHDLVIKWQEGKSKKQTLQQFCIDNLRTHLGKDGSKYYVTPEELPPKDTLYLKDIIERIPDRNQRAIFILKYIWGMNREERAYIFGYNGSSINRIDNETLKFLDQDF